jgi:mannose-6-phosphate isomerase-like protein (cupin superfamily)
MEGKGAAVHFGENKPNCDFRETKQRWLWPTEPDCIAAGVPVFLFAAATIIRNKSPWEQSQFGLGVIRMKLKERTFRATAIPCLLITALWSSSARAQEQPAAKELPRPSEITGIKPEVLTRTLVPGAPGKLAIVTRVTYDPGARIRKHYHTGQVVFYILEGIMVVQHEDGRSYGAGGGGCGTFIVHTNRWRLPRGPNQ